MQNPEFPSDIYAVESHIKLHGFETGDALIEVSPRKDECTLRTEDITEAITQHKDKLRLVMFSAVNYFTGQYFDIPAIAETCRRYGIYFGLDLAHAIGNVPLQLHDWDVDFATWCSYKYLNSGPGGVSGIFVHEKHHGSNLPRLAGWWGNNEKKRFLMLKNFEPMTGAEGWQQSNAPILSMAAHRAALEIFDEVGIEALRKKSIALTGFAEQLIIHSRTYERGILEIITPAKAEHRGCQLSLRVKENGREFFNTLLMQNIICDWREPDVIRIAPVPLYNSFEDVWKFSRALEQIA
ncbi:MAG: kynureninase [Chitinophagales bacterium]|nr:kynureninase [Chitinophagales bacterium]